MTSERCIDVVYSGENPDPQLPGMDQVPVVQLVEVDDHIVLDGSNASTGVIVRRPTGAVECEIFTPDTEGKDSNWIEVYPLDGMDQPFYVHYELSNQMSIHAPTVLEGVVLAAFQQMEAS